jgi:hypothetical protein
MSDTRLPADGTEESSRSDKDLLSEEQARRNFLRQAGRFAVVTSPTITLLLGTSLSSRAIAGSGGLNHGDRGAKPGWGWGDKNHEHQGPAPRHGKKEP